MRLSRAPGPSAAPERLQRASDGDGFRVGPADKGRASSAASASSSAAATTMTIRMKFPEDTQRNSYSAGERRRLPFRSYV